MKKIEQKIMLSKTTEDAESTNQYKKIDKDMNRRKIINRNTKPKVGNLQSKCRMWPLLYSMGGHT